MTETPPSIPGKYAYRLSGDRHQAEDIMATAFLELWGRRAKVRPVDDSVLPWLLVTTTNVGRNSGRTALRYGKLLSALPRAEDVSPDAGEYTTAAAASVLNLTPAAAKSRMHRARLRPVTTRHPHLEIRPCETTLAHSRADRYSHWRAASCPTAPSTP